MEDGYCNQNTSKYETRACVDTSNLCSQDTYLKYMAEHYELTVFSVGYRLAPEHPWPAGGDDCYDAAEWLVKNGPSVFGGELMFTGGEVGSHSRQGGHF